MCGIAVKVEFKPDEGTQARLNAGIGRALERMKERGPDGSGREFGAKWGAGHVRLAIIDIAAGAQPWRSQTGNCLMVYNGEIFNYLQLNAELKAKGHQLRTRCDTETVLESYLEWGEDCVNKFNGFFAFAIIDLSRRQLFMARDRLGVKPLHYKKDAKGISLASSVAAVSDCAGTEKIETDLEALSHFLTTGRVSFGAKTLAKGIATPRPSHERGHRNWQNSHLALLVKADIKPRGEGRLGPILRRGCPTDGRTA